MSNLVKSFSPKPDVVIGTGKSAGKGIPGQVPAGYRPDDENPLSLYRNVAGCSRENVLDYIYAIDGWNWHKYDHTKWPSADMDFPDLDEDKKYDIWPFKPDLNVVHWVDLNDMKSGQRRRGYILGYKTPEQYVGTDANKCLILFEELAKENNAQKIQAAGFKNKEHLDYVIEGTKKEIKTAYAETQKVIDQANAGLQAAMNNNIAAAKAGGLLDPVKGVSMEDWAAANAKIMGGMSLDEVCKILGIEKPAWDAVSAEWMTRMSQDTTFAISKVYGEAFSNSNIGRFATAGGASAAAGGNAAVEKVKNDFDLYIKIMCHQNMGSAQGIDAAGILKQYGLTVADWGVAGMHWAPQMGTNLELSMKMTALMDKYNAQFATAKAGSDIDF